MTPHEIFNTARQLFFTEEQSQFEPPHPIVIHEVVRYIKKRAGTDKVGQNFSYARYRLGGIDMHVEYSRSGQSLSGAGLLGRVCLLTTCLGNGLQTIEFQVPSPGSGSNYSLTKQRCQQDLKDLLTVSCGDVVRRVETGSFAASGTVISEKLSASSNEAACLENLLSSSVEPRYCVSL